MRIPRFVLLYVALVVVVLALGCSLGVGRAQAFVSYDSLSFVDAQHGWLSGAKYSLSGSNVEILWKTADGGTTWTHTGSALQPTGFTTFVTSASPTLALWWNYRGLFRTTNGGRSWKHVRGIAPWEGTATFVDTRVGWLAGSRYSQGEGGFVYRTTNGGLSWRRVLYHNTALTGYYGTSFYRLSAPSARRCYVLENEYTIMRGRTRSAVWSTCDAGVHWALKKLPLIAGYDNGYQGISFPGAVIGWVVGARGSILKTTNAGLTWTKQRSGTLVDLHAVLFANTRDGFVVGDYGMILHTTDGGLHWARQASRTHDFLEDLDRVGLSRAWVIDSGMNLATGASTNPSVLATVNDGRTWSKLLGPGR